MNHPSVQMSVTIKEAEVVLLLRQIVGRCGEFPCDILLQYRNSQFVVRETKRPERLPLPFDKMVEIT